MIDDFQKFPHTPHLLWLGPGSPREDKILALAQALDFLDGTVTVEEKVDGANLGLSVGPDMRIRAQSRGNYLLPGRCHAQWNPLWPWLAQREQDLAEMLGSKLILFGEWTYALHTIPYAELPAWFLAFDIYEPNTGRFWSAERRNSFVHSLGIQVIPNIFSGRLTLNQVPKLIGRSSLGAPYMEGVYLRRERDGLLQSRAKVVGAEFKQEIEEHWTRKAMVSNRLRATGVEAAH